MDKDIKDIAERFAYDCGSPAFWCPVTWAIGGMEDEVRNEMRSRFFQQVCSPITDRQTECDVCPCCDTTCEEAVGKLKKMLWKEFIDG